ncbi:hypothetical protein YC2023_081679 [Brassica napus]
MERENGCRTVLGGRAEIDTRPPFGSVKEAVALFGEKVLAGEVYATRFREIRTKSTPCPQPRLRSLKLELEQTKHTLTRILQQNCDTRHLLYGGQRVTPDASSYNNVTPVSLTLRTTGHQQYPRGAHSPPTNRPKHYRKGARFIHTPKKCSVTHARRRFIDTSSLQLNRSTKVGRDLHTIRHTSVRLCIRLQTKTILAKNLH